MRSIDYHKTNTTIVFDNGPCVNPMSICLIIRTCAGATYTQGLALLGIGSGGNDVFPGILIFESRPNPQLKADGSVSQQTK